MTAATDIPFAGDAWGVDDVCRGLLLAAVALHVVGLFEGIQADAGAFLTIASGLTDGRLPYIDYYDHKPPGIYLTYAAALAVYPSVFSAKVLVLVANLLTAAIVKDVGEALASARVGLVGAVVFLLASFVYVGPRLLTEPFVGLFGVLALWLLVVRPYGRPVTTVLAGAAVGVAGLYKQPGVLFVVPALLFCLRSDPARSRRRRAVDVLALAVGVAVPHALVVGWAVSRGFLDEFVYWVYLTNLPGQTYGGFGPLGLVSRHAVHVAKAPLFWLLAVAGAASAVGRPDRSDWLLVGGFVAAAAVPLALRSYHHYFLQVVPFAALFVAFGARELVREVDPARLTRRMRTVGLVTVVVLLLPTAYMTAFHVLSVGVGDDVFDDQRAGAYLSAHTEEGERILALPFRPKHYFLSGREPPSKNLYYIDVNRDRYSDESILRNVRRHDVRYVVVAKSCYERLRDVCEELEASGTVEREFAAVRVVNLSDRGEPSLAGVAPASTSDETIESAGDAGTNPGPSAGPTLRRPTPGSTTAFA